MIFHKVTLHGVRPEPVCSIGEVFPFSDKNVKIRRRKRPRERSAKVECANVRSGTFVGEAHAGARLPSQGRVYLNRVGLVINGNDTSPLGPSLELNEIAFDDAPSVDEAARIIDLERSSRACGGASVCQVRSRVNARAACLESQVWKLRSVRRDWRLDVSEQGFTLMLPITRHDL